MRPEHLNQALLAHRRSATTRLLRAVSNLVEMARRGTLPANASWILDSRLVFLAKPGSSTPRPIRVGEVWRRLVAKRLLHDQRDRIRQVCLESRQCGVAMPNGTDALVHLRRCLEKVATASSDCFVVLDLDLRNAFPRFEWRGIRDAVQDSCPALSAWTRWCHGQTARIQLPNGEWYTCDRGAEQGDPLGPVFCALVLKQVAERARIAVEEAGGWVWDLWYMDDGQVALRPHDAALYLRAFDAALAEVGGTRVAGGEFKSTAHVCGSPAARASLPASWSQGVEESCKILSGPPPKVLGVGIEGHTLDEQFRNASSTVSKVCAALQEMEDPAAELALLRMSTNACRVVHLLRAAGSELDIPDVATFDEGIDDALSSVLGGPILGLALEQAAFGAREGGLGLRRSADMRLPAFLASRVASRGLAASLASSLPGDLRVPLFTCWDAQVSGAQGDFEKGLEPGVAAVVRQTLQEAASQSQRSASLLAEGQSPPQHNPHSSERERTEIALLVEPGAEDPEHPMHGEQNLQTRLCNLGGAGRVKALRASLEARHDWPGIRRFDDLCSPETDHSWLWLLATPTGDEVRGQEFVVATRLRIGADVVATEQQCRCCGGILDVRGHHALRCASGESTRGHNRVANTLLCLASLSDGTSCAEPRGLIASRPALRPADVLTTAAFGRGAALDVSIVSPDATGAGSDPCVASVAKKMRKYSSVLDELVEAGLDYRPVTWSCWGRPDAATSAVVRSMAVAAARRRGLASPAALACRTNALIGAQIWRRAAAMVLACQGASVPGDIDALLPLVDGVDIEDEGVAEV